MACQLDTCSGDCRLSGMDKQLLFHVLPLGNRLSGYFKCPSTQQRFPDPPGGSLVIPRPDERHNPSSKFWICSGISAKLVVAQEDPNQMPGPSQLAPPSANEQWLYSNLPLHVQTSLPHLLGQASHRKEETHFILFYPQSHSFGHYAELMVIGEGLS